MAKLTAFSTRQIMTKQEFIDRVLNILNETDSGLQAESFIGADMVQAQTYVEEMFPAAWRRAANIAQIPKIWFTNLSFAGAQKVIDAPDGTGYVVLPDDYLVLSTFKLKPWRTACLFADHETPQINKKQMNEYTRGTPLRPVCVIRHKTITVRNGDVFSYEIKKALCYYSVPKAATDSEHKIEIALYVPNFIEMPDKLVVDDKLIDPLAYLTASTVLTSFEKHDLAKAMDAKVLEVI